MVLIYPVAMDGDSGSFEVGAAGEVPGLVY
jgi:hypothetical protein